METCSSQEFAKALERMLPALSGFHGSVKFHVDNGCEFQAEFLDALNLHCLPVIFTIIKRPEGHGKV